MNAAATLPAVLAIALCLAFLGDYLTRRHAAADPWSATQ